MSKTLEGVAFHTVTMAAEIARLRAELKRVREAGKAVVQAWDLPFEMWNEVYIAPHLEALRTALEGEGGHD